EAAPAAATAAPADAPAEAAPAVEAAAPAAPEKVASPSPEELSADDVMGDMFDDDEDDELMMPLFEINLTVKEGKVEFAPTLDALKSTVLGIFDDIFTAVTGIEDIRTKVARRQAVHGLVDGNKGSVDSMLQYYGDIKIVASGETQVKEARAYILKVLETNMVGPQALADSYNAFKELMMVDPDEYIEDWKCAFHSTDETHREIQRLQALADAVEAQSSNQVAFKMILVSCYPIKATLLDMALHLRTRLLQQLAFATHDQNLFICERYSDIQERLQTEATNAEELDALKKYTTESQNELRLLEGGIDHSAAVFEVLHESDFEIADESSAMLWRTAYWPQIMTTVVRESEQRQQQGRVRFMDELRRDQSQLFDDIEAIGQMVDQFAEYGDVDAVEERLVYVQDIEQRIQQSRDHTELYNSREELFGQKPTDYPQLTSITKAFEPYSMMWKTCAEFTRSLPEWMDGPFTALDSDQIANDVERWFRNTYKTTKQLKGEPLVAAQKLKQRIETFQEHLPLITALRNPGLRDRHWKKMSDQIGFQVKADSSFSVTRALQLELQKYMGIIDEVSEHASKEYSLEKTLDKMQGDWSGVMFEYFAFRETGTFILKSLDETQMLLDDQIVKTQSMRSSPYIGPFEERVRLWEKKLVTIQEIIDEWLKCQQGWLYLEPIFGSEDIMQQMPAEGRKFRAVDNTWRKTMAKLEVTSEVLIIGSDEELVKNLRDANKLLDQVQKGLNDYLETKRLAFPRFYFLSNDELLEILSETKDPLRVQPFLRKVFEAIDKLEFQEDLTVTAMFSEETERVEFSRTFNPKSAGGNVERWLIDCEIIMKESMRDVTARGYEAYANNARKQWIVEWPGQVVLCVSQMYWTKEVEEAIQDNKLKEYADQCTAQLGDIVNKVRGKLTKLERKTLAALVVIDVHARDTVVALHKEEVTEETDFEWMSQLRYVWDQDATGAFVMVRMINAQIPYGYEYLGNSSRLVITPLTDRCYRTLMGALHLQLGGAPEGPAGTGKTETTKDLAKAIAMQCVVFNCSDGLDYLAMAKFFKGLASSGAWACFDEFNRIDLEVLSVIAQQILTIQRAKSANLKMFEFEGTKLQLRDTCSVFITMNPGYAGRSELPDNLKALFRTVAMMVPDYALISEIMLYSSGYLEARPLAVKLVATYRLCSEQLSSQSHYDYGMRAVISVLRAAGAMKQNYPDQAEGVLMLRSLKDVNLPKFLAPDIPLFEGILSDLFPGVVLPAPDYDLMRASLDKVAEKMNLQTVDAFVVKTFQLYEMILVRHGLMLVGYSYGAKTSAWRALQGTLTDLCSLGLLGENKTKVVVMNPKSIYMGQLYGQFDPVSHEWQDGVLAKKYRELATDTSPDRKWVMFDGPVDAVWIENMNTVLDDNKKLCLMSGEIIQMSASMNMIFEVQDLLVASPATVSRCGMIYVEPTEMGWRPLFHSWLNTLHEVFTDLKPVIEKMFEWLVDPCVKFIRRNCKELIPTSDVNLPYGLMNLFDSLVDALKEDPCRVKPDDRQEWVECTILFSTVWSIGGSTESAGRGKFNKFFRDLISQKIQVSEDRTDYDLGPGVNIKLPGFNLQCPFPKDGSVYEFGLDTKQGGWNHWLQMEDVEPIPLDTPFQRIIVTTVDTIRYKYLLNTLMMHDKHLLFGGPTGTGKTVYVKDSLENLDKSQFMTIQSTFSAQTNANMIQDIIDAKLDKRRKGIYGPPFGYKCVIFVDDLNMPALEVYGAQPPVELLRQFMDYGGWYDRTEITFRKLVDIQMVTAMGPPGGGRNPVTPRLLRHFNLISVCEFDDASFTRIYEEIINWWCKSSKVDSGVAARGKAVVVATVEIYNTIQKELLPTPQKSHYTYNMRDLSKVFQGVSMVGTPPPDIGSLVKLWAHECMRVFQDRLTDDPDRTWFFHFLKSMVDKHMGVKFDDVFAPAESPKNYVVQEADMKQLMYADFMIPGAETRKYDEVTDRTKLLTVVEEWLQDYNAQSKSRMDLVLFLYAAQHITRISRVIRQPYGNVLLVGVGGSGRQSLTRIAAFMAEYVMFSIEISKSYTKTEWRDDLKTVLKKSGAENQFTVFLFSDTQIKEESFLEDINNILNTGEVPNLYAKDEVLNICEMVRPKAKRAGQDGSIADLFKFFVGECRQNLHMVLAMSPVGDSFRERLRMFPSLVNCCTIDWFSEWPGDALSSVAAQFLRDVEMDDEETRKNILDMCMLFHQSVIEMAVDFDAELQRKYYVTPTSYLELITTYKNLLDEKRKAVSMLRKRYQSGLQQIYSAEEQVGVMKTELIEIQPVLKKTAIETEEMLKVIDRETVEANAKKEVVLSEEAIANEKAAASKAIKDDCEQELSVAMPMLDAALSALNTLTKGDITEVKSMKSPPAGVKLVMEAICIMRNIKPKRINDPAGGIKKVDDYWGPSQALLAEPNFLEQLQTFDKDNIPPKTVEAIRPYVNNEMFDPAVVKKASNAAYGLCCWVRAMEAYDRVAKVVAPKKAKLAEAEKEFAELMKGLNQKKAELKEVEDKVAGLNEQLNQMQEKKAKLEYDVDQCSKKLVRAEKLINGLGGEKARWTQVAEDLGVDYTNLTGDVLLSSGTIAYMGAFTAKFRDQAVTQWSKLCVERKIPCTSGFALTSVLGEPVQIRGWTIDGLPNDGFSIDNAIIMSKGRRWPLMIDPQGQGNKWVKNMEKRHSLEIIKLTDGDFVRKLENCIQFGFPVLLENVGEELDPTLEPLLLKSIFKQGGSLCIRLGDSTIEYSAQFRFYITTKMRNPHYLPEVSVKVTLLNFMITPDGLIDQLLGIVVAKERPELQEEKTKLVLQGAENARQLKEVEDKIIEVLGSSEGSILEDESAINVISSAKELSVEINKKQAIAEKTEAKIDATREGYRPVSVHVSHLFFNIAELCNIEPMYQYSLAWYVNLFVHSIENADVSDKLDIRLQNLIDFFTYSLYCNICRSLFEKDKLLFSVTLAVTIGVYQGKLDPAEFRFLLTGGIGASREYPPNPAPWQQNKLWEEMVRMSDLPSFEGFSNQFKQNPASFKHIYESAEPHAETLPEPWATDLNQFQKMVALRTLRPDKITSSAQIYVIDSMGQKFTEPPPFDLQRSYNDSNAVTPLIFVLSPGSDPMSAMLKFCETMHIQMESLSLGQGQGPKAEKLIETARNGGSWVVLQNCHLAVSWMTTLERVCESFTPDSCHPMFRLWLTSYPAPHFPVAVLQNGVKMTNEPPKGLRSNIMQTYLNDPVSDPDFFNSCARPEAWKKLLFGLAFFHAFVQERIKFGPLGWNIPYQFSDPDLKISLRQLMMFLNEFSEVDLAIPLKAVIYLIGECNYGGRVTDAHDRRTLMAILCDDVGGPFNTKIMDDSYKFSPSGKYYAPPDGDYDSYMEFIKNMPVIAEPEVFGLHANADITKDQQETDLLFRSIMSMQGGGGGASGGGKSKEDVLQEVAEDIAHRMPPCFDIEAAIYKYPVDYYESMNSVLCQELVRFNRLIDIIHKSIANFIKALKGLVVMSSDLDQLGKDMFNGKMPTLWASKSYPSMKPLGSYVNELIARLKMLQGWIDNGSPPVYWISGFYFTHAFLTGVLQNFARKYKVPIDTVGFEFECLPNGEYNTKPEDGAYVTGMYLEGARWNYDTFLIDESEPKVLHTAAPMFWFKPGEVSKRTSFPHYSCPLYRTTERRGVLATTGHSSNFVLNLLYPSDKPPEYWIKRGVAGLLSLSD
ncbi:hypothetical protein CYMTET_29916, partial [Cymbomonas tetramitiformis]